MEFNMLSTECYFVREDSNGQRTIYLKETGQQLFLNATSWFVFRKCHEYDNFDDLLVAYHKEFSGVDKRELEKDMFEILKIFELYRIIKITQKSSKHVDSRDEIHFAGDLDYKDIIGFIANNEHKNQYNLVRNNEKQSDPLELRFLTMTNKEYYVIIRKDGKINTVLSFAPPNNGINPHIVLINSVCTNIKEESELVMKLDGVIEFIVNKLDIVISKIRFNIVRDNRDINAISKCIEIFRKLNFVLECELIGEFGNRDLLM